MLQINDLRDMLPGMMCHLGYDVPAPGYMVEWIRPRLSNVQISVIEPQLQMASHEELDDVHVDEE